MREDEIACRSLGINTVTTKLTAFATGAFFGGIAGAFFAAQQGFISPKSFEFMESAVILAIVVLGGLGSQIGVAIAAVVMIGGTELLRELGFLKAVFGPDFDPTQYRMLLFGLAMVLLMIWRPRGLVRRVSRRSGFARAAAPRRARRRGSDTHALAHRSHSHRRSPVDALRRPRRRQRPLVHGGARRHHGADRPERRRQDDRLQLHHRLLQADRRAHRACARGRGQAPPRSTR